MLSLYSRRRSRLSSRHLVSAWSSISYLLSVHVGVNAWLENLSICLSLCLLDKTKTKDISEGFYVLFAFHFNTSRKYKSIFPGSKSQIPIHYKKLKDQDPCLVTDAKSSRGSAKNKAGIENDSSVLERNEPNSCQKLFC